MARPTMRSNALGAVDTTRRAERDAQLTCQEKSPFQLRPKYWTNKQAKKIAAAVTTLPPIKIVFSTGSLEQVAEPRFYQPRI
jgi:hypothetical protein